MSDLAAKMAARRKKLEESEEDGMYFSGPSSGPKKNSIAAPASKGPSSANGNGSQNAFGDVKLQEEGEEEDEEEEEEEEDLQAQIQAYQNQLRTQDTAVAVMSGQTPAMNLPTQENGVQEDEEAEVENDDVAEDDEIVAYQLQLRNKDEADAVAGLAVGNLADVVATRTAPKSQDAHHQLPSLDIPASKQSQLGNLADDSFQGTMPESCTCIAGSAELCPYCVMLNGPASGNSSSAFSPNSSATPSMPASFSSMAGMPSQQNARGPSMPQSTVSVANGMSPGWSEQQPILVPADDTGNALASNGLGVKAGPAAPSASKALTNAPTKPPKKAGGLFSCCFRPKLPETTDEAAAPVLQQPNSNRSRNGFQSHGGDSVVADELVEDGVPMGGVTATSEDVMQLDGNDVLIQCNVGLSVDDPNAAPARAPPATGPAVNLIPPSSNLNAPVSSGLAGPLSSGASPPAPVSGLSSAPISWGNMLPSELSKSVSTGSGAATGTGTSGGPGLTEANLAQHTPATPASRGGRRAPTSGTSLFSVAEHAAAITVGAPAPPSQVGPGAGKQGAGQAAPVSASLQELQGLDDRRNMYLQSLATKKDRPQAPPISNTLLELQNRQVVEETVNRFGGQ